MRKKVYPARKIFYTSLLSLTHYLIFLSCISFFFSCSSYKLEKNLNPESKEFLSKVRYIITKQERKIFLNLPHSEVGSFIEDFWEKRDPDPDTDENEFKEEYFKRIEEANHLFREGGTPGWLQDRGRIHILLGPPERKEVYPRGRTFYEKPMEIWFYGFFPIVFIDNSDSGIFKLEPMSARHIAEINRAQMDLKPKTASEKVIFDFNLKIDKLERNRILIRIKVPYKNIWFTEEENKLKTSLNLSLEITDSSGNIAWEHQKSYLLSLTEENMEEKAEQDYVIEVPASLEQGNYTLALHLKNKTDKKQVRKKAKFTI